jgi:hypothetical protein
MYYDAGSAADAVPRQITGDVVDVFLRGGFLAAVQRGEEYRPLQREFTPALKAIFSSFF